MTPTTHTRTTRRKQKSSYTRKRSSGRRHTGTHRTRTHERAHKSDNGTLKVIPLGGLGEVGKNMMVIEYKDDIIIIDAGLKFPESDIMPGIDFIIPNVKYLEDKKDKIRGVVFTHGHYDHIGAIQYIQDKLGNPPLYGAPLTRGIILKRQEEFPHLPKPEFHIVHPGEVVHLGDAFTVEFYHINHNIPDNLALAIDTPLGLLFHTSDFKFDSDPVNDVPANLDEFKKIGERGVLMLMSDSTGAEEEGHSLSEKTIFENLHEIFDEAKGMIIGGTFASLLNRIQQMATISEDNNRKVVFDGYSMKTNTLIAKELGYLKMQKGTEIKMPHVHDYPRSKVTLIGTGAQGEGNAVLMRIANNEHRHIKLHKDDSVIFSSSVIPGNERTVQNLKDQLYHIGARVYHYQMMDIHAGGHAQKEDLRQMINLIKPKFFMPIHGQYSMMVTHGWLAEEEGIDKKNIILAENGSIIQLKQTQWSFSEKKAPSTNVFVDGLGVGDIGNVVLRDRQMLAEDGMFVVVALIDQRTGKVRQSPDIISRGFVYLRENKQLLGEVRKRVKTIIEHKTTNGSVNWAYLKDEVRNKIGEFLFQKTQRRPMVLPVIIEV